MEGMISKEVLAIQREEMGKCGKWQITLDKWSEGLVTRLLEVTHGQWLYRNVQVYNAVAGDLAFEEKGGD